MILFFTALFFFFSFAPSNDSCNLKNKAFQAGEVLHYKVYYNWGFVWVDAGEVTFTVADSSIYNRSAFHVVGTGKTHKKYDWFFKVRDRYETFIDRETMLPLKFIRDVYEGGYEINNNVRFSHEKNQATSVNGTYSIPDCTQDVLSAIYYSRNINFDQYKPNDTIPLTLFLDDQVYEVYIRYIGKETLTTDIGKTACIKFRPMLIEGTIFEEGEHMTVWVTDDENKIPVKVESPIIVGSVKAFLTGYKGLKNPCAIK